MSTGVECFQKFILQFLVPTAEGENEMSSLWNLVMKPLIKERRCREILWSGIFLSWCIHSRELRVLHPTVAMTFFTFNNIYNKYLITFIKNQSLFYYGFAQILFTILGLNIKKVYLTRLCIEYKVDSLHNVFNATILIRVLK